MGQLFEALLPRHVTFIEGQKIFFVGTAAAKGSVNLSPKGGDSLRVLDAHTLAWLNLTGSGNESAAQVLQQPRMTVMFCAFDEPPLILRVYGTARVIHPRDPAWPGLRAHFPDHPGARQVFDLSIGEVQTSCGFGVPWLDTPRDRPTLNQWAEKKGEAGIAQYWSDKNQLSIDQIPTGIFD